MSFQYENQFEYKIKMKKLCQKVLQLKRKWLLRKLENYATTRNFEK